MTQKENLLKQAIEIENETRSINGEAERELDTTSWRFIKEVRDGVGDMIIDKLIEQGQSVREVAHLIAYDISYAHCDYEHLQHSCQQLIRKALPIVPITDEMLEAYDILAAHREDVKKNRPRPADDKKRAELKEWADKKFPNETDEFKQDKIERAIRKWKVNRQMMYGYRRW